MVMTVTTGIPVTANAVLFGSGDAAQSLEDWLRSKGLAATITGAAAHLSGDMQDGLRHELCHVAADLLDLDLVDVLVAGWRKHAALVAAARRTAMSPGSSEIVEVATHRVTATQRPYVDLLADDVRVGRIRLELQVDFTVAGLVAIVREGRLAAVRSGRCTVAVTLMVEGERVASGSARFELPVMARLGAGLPLLPGIGQDARTGQDAG
jgi:hypothetical protein